MLNEKEVYGSTEPFGKLWDKIIKFEEIEYVKLGEEDYLLMIGIPTLIVALFYGLLLLSIDEIPVGIWTKPIDENTGEITPD